MNTNDKQFMAHKIRTQYVEKEHSELDELYALDKKVKQPANIFSYMFGTLAALVMGSGMSLVMTDIGTTLGLGDTVIPGIILGIIGLTMAVVNYPIYKNILAKRKEKFADKIVALSDEIINK